MIDDAVAAGLCLEAAREFRGQRRKEVLRLLLDKCQGLSRRSLAMLNNEKIAAKFRYQLRQFAIDGQFTDGSETVEVLVNNIRDRTEGRDQASNLRRWGAGDDNEKTDLLLDLLRNRGWSFSCELSEQMLLTYGIEMHPISVGHRLRFACRDVPGMRRRQQTRWKTFPGGRSRQEQSWQFYYDPSTRSEVA